MPSDPTRPDQPGVSPPGDPRLASVATRLRVLRIELDRTDAAVDMLDRHERVEFARRTTAIRAELDQLEADVERQAAGR